MGKLALSQQGLDFASEGVCLHEADARLLLHDRHWRRRYVHLLEESEEGVNQVFSILGLLKRFPNLLNHLVLFLPLSEKPLVLLVLNKVVASQTVDFKEERVLGFPDEDFRPLLLNHFLFSDELCDQR